MAIRSCAAATASPGNASGLGEPRSPRLLPQNANLLRRDHAGQQRTGALAIVRCEVNLPAVWIHASMMETAIQRAGDPHGAGAYEVSFSVSVRQQADDRRRHPPAVLGQSVRRHQSTGPADVQMRAKVAPWDTSIGLTYLITWPGKSGSYRRDRRIRLLRCIEAATPGSSKSPGSTRTIATSLYRAGWPTR